MFLKGIICQALIKARQVKMLDVIITTLEKHL